MTQQKFVLDSFALIVYFEKEQGWEKVVKLLREAEKRRCTLWLSVVNWGEVYYSIYRAKGERKAEEALMILDQLPVKIVLPDRTQTYQAAKLKAKFSIAFADCFTAALALQKQAKVVTGDPEFRKLEREVGIEWLPAKER